MLRKVQTLSLKGGAGLENLMKSAHRKLTAADVSGGTFTISNHGVRLALRLADHHQPAAIGDPRSAAREEVVVREVDGVDAIQIRPMCYVSLTIDHRVVDGHQTNGWLSRFVELLEGGRGMRR